MGTYSDYEQRLLDQQTGEEMDRLTCVNTQRASFEAWVRATFPHWWPNPDENGMRYGDDGAYRNARMQTAWLSWQASGSRDPVEIERMRAALTEIMEYDQNPAAQHVARRGLGLI
jgi:hypothetical protein